VLVNNAAVLVFGEITALSKRDFERAVSINLVGTFLGIRTVATCPRRMNFEPPRRSSFEPGWRPA
jgi:NAD(P)-dependent dehydrogenase (short-subunit alcohol dehydrogenase family)